MSKIQISQIGSREVTELQNIYCNVTFSEVFKNFKSFISALYKSNLIFTLLFTAFKLCCNF